MSAGEPNLKTSQRNETIKVRVMADSSVVEGVADRIIGSLGESDGLKVVDRSRPYPCRAPEEGKARIYLTFSSDGRDRSQAADLKMERG